MRLFNLLFASPKKPLHSVRRKVWLLGQEYAIQIAPGTRNSAKIKDGVIHMTLKEMSRQNFEAFSASWFRRTSRKILEQSIERWRIRLWHMGYELEPPRIKVYKMSRAWGRCYYTKNVITFNAALVTTPQQCVDCITLHELCHMLIHTHDPYFYGLMTRVEPEWRAWDAQLKEFAKQRGLTR